MIAALLMLIAAKLYLGDNDPTTRRRLESILASELVHAEDLGTLLSGFGSDAVSTNP